VPMTRVFAVQQTTKCWSDFAPSGLAVGQTIHDVGGP
jgi:hypothetical protein